MADSPNSAAAGASDPGDGPTGPDDRDGSTPTQPPDQPGYPQTGYGPAPYGQSPPGQAPPQGRPPYGQAPPSGQPPYGQAPYGQTQYGQAQYGQPQQGQPPPYGQPPYGQPPYGQHPYGQPPYGQTPYGQSGYAPPPYGSSPYGQWVPPAPKPGIIPLRPLNISEILDGAFTAMRRNPKATLGLAAVVMTVYGIVTTGTTLALSHLIKGVALPPQGQPLTDAQARQLLEHLGEVVLPALAVTVIVGFLADTILTGMLTAVIGHSVLGRRISITEAWRIAAPRIAALVGSTLLAGLVFLGVLLAGGGTSAVIGAVLIAAHVAPAGVLLIVVGVLASLVAVVIFWVRFGVAAPAVVLEGQGAATSLSRSWRLVKKSSWRVFGILLLTELIVLIATGVLQVPFGIIGAVIGHGSGGYLTFGGGSSTNPSVAVSVISAIGGIVAGSVTRPVLAGARVLLYVDLRMRREGLDIALQSAASQSQPGQAVTEFDAVWSGQPGMPGPASAPGQTTTDRPASTGGPTSTSGQDGPVSPPDQQRW